MSETQLDRAAARQLIGEIFVYHMPFNQALGLELKRLESNYAELRFANKTMLVGNAAQQILHGGVIASVLDVAAGLVCVNSSLTRRSILPRRSCVTACRVWAPSICAWIICVPDAANTLSPPAACCAPGIKSPSRASNCITTRASISPAPRQPILLVNFNRTPVLL